MVKLKKSKKSRMYIDEDKENQHWEKDKGWVDACLDAVKKAGLIIPIVYSWYKGEPTATIHIVVPVKYIGMAEEILDNNRKFFKTVSDVFRAHLFAGGLLNYKNIMTRNNKDSFGVWGKTHYVIMLQMQTVLSDLQQQEHILNTMEQYSKNKTMKHERFRSLCRSIIDSVPEENRAFFEEAYNRLRLKESISDLRELEIHGGPRENAGRKATAKANTNG